MKRQSSPPPVVSDTSRVSSKRAAGFSTSDTLSFRPGSASSCAGAFCNANITWKSGVRLEVALGLQLLDELLERQVLMRVGLERDFAHAPEQLAEGRVAREVCAQHERVDEEPDEVFDLAASRFATGVPTTMSVWPV